MALWIPTMYCMGCHHAVCHNGRLASHSGSYACPNPDCEYHAAPALGTGPGSGLTLEATSETALVRSSDITPESSNLVPSTATTTTSSNSTHLQNGNLAYRETYTREWWPVDGQIITPPGRSSMFISASATSTATQTISTQADEEQADTAIPDTTPADVARAFLPDNITDEEINAQRRLVAKYEQRQLAASGVQQ